MTEHERTGLFARMHIGPGGAFISGGDDSSGGPALDVGAELGGFVARGFGLALDVSATGVPATSADGAGGVVRAGPALCFVFAPADVFVSWHATLSVGAMQNLFGFAVGLGTALTVGKEWPLSESWHWGVSGFAGLDYGIGLWGGILPVNEWLMVTGGASLVFTAG